MKQILTAFTRNTVFANIVLILILSAGGMALIFMVREVLPDVSMDEIQVSVQYPGADPEEVEEGITRKIEDALEGMPGIRQYTTTSGEDGATATITVMSNYETSDVIDRVRSRIGAISTFPRDAEKPLITEMIHQEEVMKLFLAGDMPENRLKELAARVKDEIRQAAGVSQIEISGTREYEISIEVSEQRLREYGLSFDDVAHAVSSGNINMAGGSIRTEDEDIRIRTLGRKYTGSDLASLVVLAKPGGEIITLDRVADIRDGFAEDTVANYVDGERAVTVDIFKTPEDDAIAISEAIHEYVEKKQQILPEGVRLGVLYDTTDELRSRINLMVKNGIMGLCLVLLLLWMFLDFRLSFWAGMGIPVSIMGALVILWAMGGTVNMISLGGLILVLGIVVDDAIVVGEAIFYHRSKGLPGPEAAVSGVSEVGMPVTATILTTIMAFIPLAYLTDIIGKFIAVMPMVVIPCLVVSLVECIFLLPAHLSHSADPATKKKKISLFPRIEKFHHLTRSLPERMAKHVYAPVLDKALRWRYISICFAICIFLLTIGLLLGGILKFEVLPSTDSFIIDATVKFPSGTPSKVTHQALEKLESALSGIAAQTRTRTGEPLIKNRLTVIGQTIGEDSDDTESGPNVGTVRAILIESEKRDIRSEDLSLKWEKAVGPVPGVEYIKFGALEEGPGGEDIELWVRGHDLEDILGAADKLMAHLRGIRGVSQVNSDFSSGKNELRFELKPEARTLGLTLNDLATQMHAGFYGKEAVRLQRGRDDVRVKVRYVSDERRHISDLERVRIRTKNGHEVPLLSVANVEFSPGYSTINRVDSMRCVTVTAAVDKQTANSDDIISDISETFIPGLKNQYPETDVSFEGEQEHMEDAVGGLIIGFPLAVIGMFIVIATMFRSYVQPFLILFMIPFGIIGSIWGHLILGYELSLMSIFGMVGLTGVVVNDAIVLIERINGNLANGDEFFKAVQNGGLRRFRAIILTTVSTVGGLSPLILETDIQAQFLIPMAVSMAAGVAFATILTLVLLPGMLVILNDLRRVFHRLRTGEWPSREEVEPALSVVRCPVGI
ncbi:efflux RND transporter permease subunit [Desulfococcaceae bacterium HSG8]|nr:efflux RND transporter permease subunit [Desulfococcaceae bacterium HSG8]